MRPGREMDCAVAEKVFGHRIFLKEETLYEETPNGDRLLRFYSKDMECAWSVVTKMGISVIPIQEGSWFALVGHKEGWKSPAEFIEYLQSGEFVRAGAAVGADAPQVICSAALSAIDNRNSAELRLLN